MTMIAKTDLAKGYWVVVTGLLIWGLTAQPVALSVALAVAALQVSHVALRERSLFTVPVKIRMVYLLLMMAVLAEPFQWLLWLHVAAGIAGMLGVRGRRTVVAAVRGERGGAAAWMRRFRRHGHGFGAGA